MTTKRLLIVEGRHVYATDNGDNAVVVFTRDNSTGQLTYVKNHEGGVDGVDGLEGTHSVAVTPDGHHVYVTGDEDHAVAAFARNETAGALSFIEMEQDGVDGLAGGFSVAVSPDGDYVYATGYYDNAMAVFERDEATGELEYREVHRDGVGSVDGLDGIRSVTVSLDGKHVYTTSHWDDAVAVFGWRFPAHLPLVLKASP